MINKIILTLIVSTIFSCGSFQDNTEPVELEKIIEFEYAKGLSMYQTNEGKVVTISNPLTQEILDHFIISNKESTNLSNIKTIKQPITKVLTYSSTYISFLDKLNEVDKIVGVTFSEGIQNKNIKKRLEEKKVKDVGSDQDPDKELVLSLNPDLAMVYPSEGNHNWFSSFDIPTITNVEYLEIHPLAQAEWIKLYGALFNRDSLALEIFNSIKIIKLYGWENQFIDRACKMNTIIKRFLF